MNWLHEINNKLLSAGGIFVVALLFLAGCSQSPNAPENSELNINGQVLDQRVQGVEGAQISVAKINEDGSVDVIAENQTETNASGNFHVQMPEHGNRPLVVIAQKGNEEWKTIVDNSIPSETGEIRSVVDFESTIESQMFIELMQKYRAQDLTYADVRRFIGSDEAAQVAHNRDRFWEFLEQFIQWFYSRHGTQIKAEVQDSTSFVKIHQRFLASFESDSALVDTIMARFQLDSTVVDSLLHLEQEDDDHYDWGGEIDSHLWIRVNRWAFPFDSTNRKSIKVRYLFTSDSTTRADLVAAVVARSQLTRAQIESALEHSGPPNWWGWNDDDGHGWDWGDNGDHDWDDDGPWGDQGLSVQVQSNITLSQGTNTTLDSLQQILEDGDFDEEFELELFVMKQNGSVTVTQDGAADLPAPGVADLWDALVQSVENDVDNASQSFVSVHIEIEYD